MLSAFTTVTVRAANCKTHRVTDQPSASVPLVKWTDIKAAPAGALGIRICHIAHHAELDFD